VKLIVAAPVGFVKVGDHFEKDPDRQVQGAIELVFDKVAELGSAPGAPMVPRTRPQFAREAEQW
jgi:hypothetical protein